MIAIRIEANMLNAYQIAKVNINVISYSRYERYDFYKSINLLLYVKKINSVFNFIQSKMIFRKREFLQGVDSLIYRNHLDRWVWVCRHRILLLGIWSYRRSLHLRFER